MKIVYKKKKDILKIFFSQAYEDGRIKEASVDQVEDISEKISIYYDDKQKYIAMEIFNASKVLDLNYLKKLEFRER
jgi:uncharacterized protein YuzE